MKTLYIDCSMGAAGDMLTAALLELFPDRNAVLDEINSLGIPGVHTVAESSVKCGITGTHVSVMVNGEEEGGDEHHHDHGHHHEHHHSSLHDISHIVSHLKVSDKVRSDIIAVYTLIAEAESAAHGVPVTEIHFHEVGTMDAVADVSAVCLLMEKLGADEVTASPVHVGCGSVKCAHGILPVPAPATAYILKDVPVYGGKINGELCTPTGAALLKHFVSRFGEMPVMRTSAIGYGMGKKDFEAANCVRMFLGERRESCGMIAELSCNLDDMSAEEIGFAMERLFDAGALDVFTLPCGMKKSRPGVLLTVLCRDSDRKAMVREIFTHTSTLGIRENTLSRYTLDRKVETVSTQFGPVRKKVSLGYGVKKEKWEYDDIAAIAREKNISIDDVIREIEA